MISFPLISDWLAREVRNGKKIQIGEDPWIEVGNICILFIATLENLKDIQASNLNEAKSQIFLKKGKLYGKVMEN